MNLATSIIITGCSAGLFVLETTLISLTEELSSGGLATYQHTDYIASLFPSAVVKAAPVSGYFLTIPNLDGVTVYAEQMEACLNHVICISYIVQSVDFFCELRERHRGHHQIAGCVLHAKLDIRCAPRLSCSEPSCPIQLHIRSLAASSFDPTCD